MDKICIRRLEVYAHHGVYEEEKRLGQKFYITVEMELDTRAAGISDDLQASVNYGEVCLGIVEWTKSHRRKLIEAAAEDIAHYLLVQYPMVRKVTVELEKPGAPVPYAFDTVLVHIERSRHQAFLGIGSNLGDRPDEPCGSNPASGGSAGHTGDKAFATLSDSTLRIYGSAAVFLNGCIGIETLYTPEELLRVLHEIEHKLGRKREIHWGPRTLDLDILFYDDLILDTPDLHIPHADMANREFVLQPLSDIAGDFRHPVINETVNALLAALKKQSN